jgi:hypothetical protein
MVVMVHFRRQVLNTASFSGNEPGVNLPTADDDIQCQDYYCRFNLARPLGGNARITEVASVAFAILHR